MTDLPPNGPPGWAPPPPAGRTATPPPGGMVGPPPASAPSWAPPGAGDGPPSPPRRRRSAAPAIAVTVVAVAVAAAAGLVRAGDDGSPTGRDGYVEALTAIGESHGVQVDNGRCFAGATVDTLGLDALREVAAPGELRDGAGRAPRAWGISFDEAQSVAFYDRLQDCIDTRRVYLDSLRERGLTDEGMACVEESLGHDLLRRFYVILWLDLEDPIDTDADLARDFRAALGHCPFPGT